MAKKIKLGILGGGGDSLIGVLHRVASAMHDQYEIVSFFFINGAYGHSFGHNN